MGEEASDGRLEESQEYIDKDYIVKKDITLECLRVRSENEFIIKLIEEEELYVINEKDYFVIISRVKSGVYPGFKNGSYKLGNRMFRISKDSFKELISENTFVLKESESSVSNAINDTENRVDGLMDV